MTDPSAAPADNADDLAAELDDDDQTEADVDASPADDDDGTPLNTGTCLGGPYDGRAMASRCPKGFVLVDKPGGNVWIYDWCAPAAFTCRSAQATPVDNAARWRAADETDYDVFAYDPQPARQ